MIPYFELSWVSHFSWNNIQTLPWAPGLHGLALSDLRPHPMALVPCPRSSMCAAPSCSWNMPEAFLHPGLPPDVPFAGNAVPFSALLNDKVLLNLQVVIQMPPSQGDLHLQLTEPPSLLYAPASLSSSENTCHELDRFYHGKAPSVCVLL